MKVVAYREPGGLFVKRVRNNYRAKGGEAFLPEDLEDVASHIKVNQSERIYACHHAYNALMALEIIFRDPAAHRALIEGAASDLASRIDAAIDVEARRLIAGGVKVRGLSGVLRDRVVDRLSRS